MLCCIPLLAQAERFNARVIAVLDGDTVLVLRGQQKIKVRLANIDAPEVGHAGLGGMPPNSQKDQPFGAQSRASLQEMVGRKQVQVDSQAVDQYGRIVAQLSVDGLNVNQEQVQRGMAWEYSHYHSDKTYIRLQSAAQQARRGLWSQASPQAPWQWRRLHPSVKSEPIGSEPVKRHAATRHVSPTQWYDMECGKKRRCAQMSSCDEAHFYLTRCGVKTLDGNHDGVPCASLCVGQKK
ncbi:MAG: thermonuclease family protein [Nitrosomonadales bacterium]|nr:thermonuclease family protein [Nitrosomonadales bacterium]